jgi:hypothetical protein
MSILDRIGNFISHPLGSRGVEPPRLAGLWEQRSIITGKKFPVLRLGFGGIKDEAAYIRKMINETHGDLGLKELALDIIRGEGVEPRDEEGQAAAIGKWVQQNIYYVHEPIEFFQKPATTLRLRAGDCDDQTILMGGLLENIGIMTKAVLMKVNGRWRHIFPCAKVCVVGHGCHRVPVDTTLRRSVYRTEDFPSPIVITQDKGKLVETLEA